MLKLPKGLKKKKKGKKSKRKGEEELFTEEELEKYKKEHQQQNSENSGAVKENEEWSKFKDLTTGIDSVLKKTQGDLDRIKSTSFFQRVPSGPKQLPPKPKAPPHRPVVEVTAADFPQLVQPTTEGDDGDKSDYGVTDDESEDDDQDDIFDTSYVEAVERGEVKLAYVPDSPEDFQDDDIFDTSHVDAIIKGQESGSSKGKKGLDIGLAVGVLTGRIDNVTVTSKRVKRVIPGDLLLESTDRDISERHYEAKTSVEPVEQSILDTDSDLPITSPIDLSVSLHTSLLAQQAKEKIEEAVTHDTIAAETPLQDEFDEFSLLAAQSLEVSSEVTKLGTSDIIQEPVIQESWSAFEANKNDSVFAECIVEDQIDVIDPYLYQDDPFDTSFADAVIPATPNTGIVEEDDDFDPRAEEVRLKLNNRRKSSVRIHLTDPSGVRESITSDDIVDREESEVTRDLLGGSTTDLTQLGDSPLDPVDINSSEIDPFDTTIVDRIVAPGKVELKLLEEELISRGESPIYRVPSDPDFDPREDEPRQSERRASRPENLGVSKSVGFNVESIESIDSNSKVKNIKPVTPYYTREVSITEDISEEQEAVDSIPDPLIRTHSEEDLFRKPAFSSKRRHSEYPQPSVVKVKASDLLHNTQTDIKVKVLTPSEPKIITNEADPFDTSFASNIAPSKTELKLLAKEFSCEDTDDLHSTDRDLLDPSDDIFQAKALTPEPSNATKISENDYDPFDTTFAGDLNPGKTELKLLESEFLN